MVRMKSLIGACAICLASLPANALVYDVDLFLDDYTYRAEGSGWVLTKHVNQTDSAGNAIVGDPISILGQVETDGSLGTIDSGNILSWSFTISSTSGSEDISSTGRLGGAVHTYGSFEATSTQLFTGSGRWGFLELMTVPEARVIGRVYGENGSLHTHAYFQDLSVDCSSGTCETIANQGNRAIGLDLSLLGTVAPATFSSSVVTTQVVTNPVPASLPLILSAFGLLGFLGWRRRSKA